MPQPQLVYTIINYTAVNLLAWEIILSQLKFLVTRGEITSTKEGNGSSRTEVVMSGIGNDIRFWKLETGGDGRIVSSEARPSCLL